ncbi:MAG: hypothetical protein JXJ30_08440 [Halothiobacillaceae bacterium]|nr:hypothetical protein [Halothiobacillaceae bacterium]HER35142.1 hypothetical protein [Halothiobacillaceae bacterium]
MQGQRTLDIDQVFHEINAERRLAGLPQVELSVMRVRVNIRLSIAGVERLPSSGRVEVDDDQLAAIARAISELFNTAYTVERLANFERMLGDAETPADQLAAAADAAPGQAPAGPASSVSAPRPVAPVTDAVGDEPRDRLYMVDFFTAINQVRRRNRQLPIEPAVVIVRVSVRFAIVRRRRLNFDQAWIEVSPMDVAALETILAEQFDVHLEQGMARLIDQGRARARQEPRKLSWVDRIFRRRNFNFHVNDMVMAITRQRAQLGYHPKSPREIQECCEKLLADMNVKFRDGRVRLTEAQMDQLAEFLREEYGLYFEDLDSFIGVGALGR